MEEDKTELVTCPNCSGSGNTSRLQSYGIFNNWVKVTCFKCNGSGKVQKDKSIKEG